MFWRKPRSQQAAEQQPTLIQRHQHRCPRVCEVWELALNLVHRNPPADQIVKASPFIAKGLKGRESRPGAPTAHTLADGARLSAARTTFPRHSFSLLLASAFAFSVRTFNLHEGNEPCPLKQKTMIYLHQSLLAEHYLDCF